MRSGRARRRPNRWRSSSDEPEPFGYFDAVRTYAELDRASDALAVAFLEGGLRPGDRVALYLQNVPQYLSTTRPARTRGCSRAMAVPYIGRPTDNAPEHGSTGARTPIGVAWVAAVVSVIP